MKTYPSTRESMLNHFGLVLTDEQLEMFANKNRITRRDLKGDICDTIDRDYLIDAVVVYVLGEDFHWPLNSDDATYTDVFYAAFFAEASRKGIAVAPGIEKRMTDRLLRFSESAEPLAKVG
jgi:hypothetical protein